MAFNHKKSENDDNLVDSPFIIGSEETADGQSPEEPASAAGAYGDFAEDGFGFIIDDDTYAEEAVNNAPAARGKKVKLPKVKKEQKQPKADEVSAEENTAQEEDLDKILFSDFASEKPEKERVSIKERLKAFFTKGKIIAFSCVFAGLLVLAAAFFALSHYWRNGELKMPGFIAATGLYQGKSFKFFDCITVNGVNIGGLTEEQAIKKIEAQMKVQSLDYDITIKYDDKTVSLTKNDFDYSISNTELKKAKEYCIKIMKGETGKKDKEYTVPVSLSKKCKTKLLKKVHEIIHKDPVNASFLKEDSSGLVFVEEQKGYDVDDDDLLSKLEKTIAERQKTAVIVPKVNFTEPKVNKDDLSANIELLSSFSTTSRNTANGTANMTKAMKLCNGTVIEPGETWSFNKTTGNSEDQSAGWLPAAAYSGGYVVQSIGGGICQASTTIYVAALYANLSVVERSAHAWQSSYASPGFDATVDYTSLDLKLKNTSKYPVYLSCSVSGRVLTCKIYGSKKDNFDKIDVFTETTSYVANDYFTVRTYRTVHKGSESKTSVISNSKYSLKPQMTRAQAEEEERRKREEEEKQKQQEQQSSPSSTASDTSSDASSDDSSSDTSSGDTSSDDTSSDDNSSLEEP